MGDVNRITHNYGDGTLEKIMSDLDHGKKKRGKAGAQRILLIGEHQSSKKPL